jgi:hypothetical protein
MPKSTAAAIPVETDEYSTTAVETREDMWTARISRTERSAAGEPETVSALVDVGSISHLFAVTRAKESKD